MNRICNACNLEMDKNNHLKDTTVCRSCYNKNRRKSNINTSIQNEIITSHKQPKIEKNRTNNKNRTLLVGPSFSGKPYLMLKILSRKPDRDIYIIIKSPPQQYSNTKIQIKEIGDELKPLNEYKNAIIVFDDILGSTINRYIDQFFIRSRHKNLDIYYLSQPFFDSPKGTIRKNSNKINLFS